MASARKNSRGRGMNPFLKDKCGFKDDWRCGEDDDSNREENREEFHRGVKQTKKWDFMNCDRCSLWCPPPVYFCTRGHIFCYFCAAKNDNCIRVRGCSGKICMRKIIAYDELFEPKNSVSCINEKLGCLKKTHPRDIVNHAWFHCKYRRAMACSINECSKTKPKIPWGFIDEHMTNFHKSVVKVLDPNCSKETFTIPYSAVEEGVMLTPVIFDKDDTRKFVAAIKKESKKMYFWIFALQDGYNHKYFPFLAEIFVRTKDRAPYYKYRRNIDPSLEPEEFLLRSKCIEIDIEEFEKKCLFSKSETGDEPYFIADFEVFESGISMNKMLFEEEKYTDFSFNFADSENAATIMKTISISDIIFSNRETGK